MTMHSWVPRRVAAAVQATSFICPSCATASSTTTTTTTTTTTGNTGRGPALRQQRRHLSSSPSSSAPSSSSQPHHAQHDGPGYARLTSRRLISIAGADAAKFLQGIVTSSTLNRSEGFYTGFLNATGRVLHDVFIYPDTLRVGPAAAAAAAAGGGSSRVDDAFIIEVDADQQDTLLKHLKRYRLRSKFQIAPVEDDRCRVWQVWTGGVSGSASSSGSSDHPVFSLDSPDAKNIILPDTRAPGLGYRLLSTQPPAQLTEHLSSRGFHACSEDQGYRVRRYLLGVPEGQVEIPREAALPLESNMDVMGGIDFRKGCYVGQELTIRTKHRGVVRKRVLPVVLYGDGDGDGTGPPSALEYIPGGRSSGEISAAETLPQGLFISRATSSTAASATVEGANKKAGRSAGTWLRGVGNIGLALCRLQMMTDVEPGESSSTSASSSTTKTTTTSDPAAAEFVLKMIGEEGQGAEDHDGSGSGSGSGGGAQQPQQVRVKAFVPPWLRQKLDEANASSKKH